MGTSLSLSVHQPLVTTRIGGRMRSEYCRHLSESSSQKCRILGTVGHSSRYAPIDEEKATDEKLTQAAENAINVEDEEGSEKEEETTASNRDRR